MQPALRPPPNNGSPQDEHLVRFEDSEFLLSPSNSGLAAVFLDFRPSLSVVNEDGASEQGSYVMYHS